MLAPHRDQENLVRSHHRVPVKQQPKTPGARYPKTPLRFHNDENAPNTLAGKTGIGGGATKPGGNDKSKAMGTKGRSMVTPMENRSRAPLGNKTTNAKARTGWSVGVKDLVKEIEKSQAKQATQKPKPNAIELGPAIPASQAGNDHAPKYEEEPEYVPPQPTPLPYQSDVLPEGGLTFEGLKKENFLKGFYEHFHNPVDETGVSREEKKFNEEMQAVLKKAEDRNAREAADMDWSIEDMAETVMASRQKSGLFKQPESSLANKTAKRTTQKHPPTVSPRRAASMLAIPWGSQKAAATKSQSSCVSSRKPLTALVSGNKSAKGPVSSTRNSIGELASRTTIGYNKGRSASSAIHSRREGFHNRSGQTGKPLGAGSANLEFSTTPARMREYATSKEAGSERLARPEFLSIFDDMSDEDLPSMRGPLLDSDDEQGEFELKLTI